MTKTLTIHLILLCFFTITFSASSQTNFIDSLTNIFESASINDTTRINHFLQQQKNEFDVLYGLDFDLFNGKKYYPVLKVDSGNPFWGGPQPHIGNITMNGRKYKDLNIMYNINKHNFVLEYIDLSKAVNRLVLNNQLISKVEFNENIFIKNEFDEIAQPFIQVVYMGKLACYFAWNKEYAFKYTGKFTGYKFSQEIRTFYIYFNNKIEKIKNKKTFLKLFDKETKKVVSNYISKNKINVKKSELSEIRQLIKYCNTLL